MDQTQVNELRAWARRLEERATSDELRAAAKAILLLADEVDALNEKVDSTTVDRPGPVVAVPEQAGVSSPPAAPSAAEPGWDAANERLSGSFVSRIKRTFGFQ